MVCCSGTEELSGTAKSVAPASGSQCALLTPDNATANFTKVVQRIPVRIQLDKGQPLLERLLPGMSVGTRIHTDEAGADGGKLRRGPWAARSWRHRTSTLVRCWCRAARLVSRNRRHTSFLR